MIMTDFHTGHSWTNSLEMAQQSVTVTVIQPSQLIDSRIDVVISKLFPQKMVTVALGIAENQAVLTSFAHFIADSNGTVQLSRDASIGGTYQGVDSMGLFWSMRTGQEHVDGMRLIKKNILEPYLFKLAVFDGHLKINSIQQFSSPAALCRTEIERWYHDAENVDRIPVRHGRLRGALFVPKHRGHSDQLPGILDFFGGGGGLMEFRAALLATKGFVVFSLAYFAYDDLPKHMSVDLVYFDEAVDYLVSQPTVSPRGIGVMGNSKGSEMAIHLGIYNSHIRAVIAMCGSPLYIFGTRPSDKYSFTKFEATEMSMYLYKGNVWIRPYTQLKDIPQSAYLPVEKAPDDQHFLLVQGGDDLSTLLHPYELLIDKLKAAGKTNYKVLNLPGAGHLIEPPYTPLNRAIYTSIFGVKLLYGGYTKPHSEAQEKYWSEVVTFFREKLSNPEQLTSKL